VNFKPNIGNGFNFLSIGSIPDIRSDRNKCFSGPNRFLPDLSVGLAGRPWLVFLENDTMACNVCINHYGKKLSGGRGQNTFISGCSNLKVSAVSVHERSQMHLVAYER
jgi:hypothetical protein